MAKLKDDSRQKCTVELLKAAVIYRDLLNDYERDFTGGIANRYAKYGSSLQVRGDQWDVLKEIAEKLNVPWEAT
jgi:hypothetical protein